MEKIAVFVNDADYAQHLLQPMLRAAGPTHWVLVACAPVLTRHIGRWVSQAARRQWRERWAADLFAKLKPDLGAQPGSQVETLLAGRPLIQVTARLEARFDKLRLLDARRPRLGAVDEPITLAQPELGGALAGPVAAATGLSLVLVLAD